MSSPLEPGRAEGGNVDERYKENLTPDSSDKLHQPESGNARRATKERKNTLLTHEPHEGANIKGRIVTSETLQ